MLLLKNSVRRNLIIFLVIAMSSISAIASNFNQVVQRHAYQGDAVSQYVLGLIYYKGEGVPKNYTKAAEWYKKAANQGDANAQNLIAGMYYLGEGVPKDYAKAAEWYKKAANQDHAKAQQNLGRMYYLGEGVRRNIVTAKEWSGKSCDNGEQKGCDSYKVLSDRGY